MRKKFRKAIKRAAKSIATGIALAAGETITLGGPFIAGPVGALVGGIFGAAGTLGISSVHVGREIRALHIRNNGQTIVNISADQLRALHEMPSAEFGVIDLTSTAEWEPLSKWEPIAEGENCDGYLSI